MLAGRPEQPKALDFACARAASERAQCKGLCDASPMRGRCGRKKARGMAFPEDDVALLPSAIRLPRAVAQQSGHLGQVVGHQGESARDVEDDEDLAPVRRARHVAVAHL